ncbi:MAG: peptidoglycan-associated lipoprotein Pal [Gammaproteobacteria bacterium]|nr:peptidoglycan-associated lipoprotein Pal [Gammaproteobacteria bacterium]
MNGLIKGLAVVLAVSMLWGCSSKPVTSDKGAEGAATAGADKGAATSGVDLGGGAAGSAISAGTSESTVAAAVAANVPDDLMSKLTVYFDYDKSDVTAEGRKIIEAHARYLTANPKVRVTLEGHADERGTPEYNLALGERRAKAVDQVMKVLNVAKGQLDTVSFGEERPAVIGSDESSWAKNRRVEIVYSK